VNISLTTSSISFLSLLFPRRNFATQIKAKQFNSGKVCPRPLLDKIQGKFKERSALPQTWERANLPILKFLTSPLI